MKKNLSWMVIFVALIFGLAIFTGCAEKKSVVTNVTPQEQEIAPAQTVTQKAAQKTETVDQNESAETANPSKTTILNNAVKEQSARVEPATTAQVYVRDINFDFDSSIIRPDAREILKVDADYFLKNRVSILVIEGHCDEQGTAEYNMALGQRRAEETKKYLINLGIKESIIKTISYGEERPLDPNSNEEAWAKNRRAHFVLTP